MINRIALMDFQSWKQLDMKLGPITMIVGRGNTGKTAIMRALRYALTNQSGDTFIREGASETRVGIETDDYDLVWIKQRGKGGEYLLAGEEDALPREFTKLAGGVPEAVEQATGIRAVAIDKQISLMPQLQMQFDAPFILAESGSKIARILGKLTRLNVLIAAQMLCRTALTQTQRSCELNQMQIEVARAELEQLADPAPLLERMEQLTTRRAELAKTAEDLLTAEGALTDAEYYDDARGRNPAKLAERAVALNTTAQELRQATTNIESAELYVRDIADAGLTVDRLAEELEECRTGYEALCNENLCEKCPWR